MKYTSIMRHLANFGSSTVVNWCYLIFRPLHVFYFWTPHFGWTPRLNYTMLYVVQVSEQVRSTIG